ncbi:rho GTPase-activating protein 6-like isoform X1 [Centruroides vittatus]|uniref:rho GTPase-activating protein 6-like isoform X1 n=2 Tax=Centruroides vittatus TaxID=120091 RepID=UPI0035103FBA
MGVFGLDNEQDVSDMQKNKNQTNSSNRLTIVPKKLWKSRAKSQTRVPATTTCAWMPEGNCCWKTENGYKVTLSACNLLTLSEVERLALQQMALTKLRAMNLNCKVDIPKADSSALKMKRRTALLRTKAKTATLDGKDIPSENSLFGIPLQQCIQKERLSRHRGSVQPLLAVDDVTNYPNFLDDARLGATSKRNSLCPDNVEAQTHDNDSYLSNMESSDPQIPNVVNSCVRHLEEYGLHTLGLFRVTSSKRRVRQLREDLESGSIVNLNENHHPHDVAQLLKEYFRDLPEPLLTRDLYSCFVAAQRQKDENKQLDIIRYLIYLLPVQNRDTLWTLLHFLSIVAQNAADTCSTNGVRQLGNRMDSSNLATLFGPNILHTSQKKGKDYEYVVERAYKAEECCDVINVVQKLIDNYRRLFTVKADDLDSTYRRLLLEDPDALQNILNKLYIHKLESGRGNQNSYSDGRQTFVQEVKIERSRQRDKKTVVLPIITISSDNKNIKSSTLLLEDDSNNTLVPPGLRDDSPSLRRKSFPDQIIDRSSLLEVNSQVKPPTFTFFVDQDNSLSRSNESISVEDSKQETLDYYKITKTSNEEYLTLSPGNIQTEEQSQRGRRYLKKPEDKFSIEKSASTSSIASNKIHEKREKSHKITKYSSKVNSKQTGANTLSKMVSLIVNPNYDTNPQSGNQRNTNHNHSSPVHYQQERWKRWEIIASEHTEV